MTIKPKIVAVIAVPLLALAACSYKVVPSEQLGVVHSFGVVEKQPLQKGPHFMAPWQKVELVTMEFTDLNFIDGDTSKDDSLITCATADGVTVDIPLTVNWAINPLMLTTVKAQQPGFYTDREYVIVRSAVRDAVSKFKVSDGSVFDREAVLEAIIAAIQSKTVSYYQEMGFGENSNKIVRYGLITLRGVFPPDEVIQANQKIIVAKLTALANAAKVKVPAGMTAEEYSKVLQAVSISKAVDDGKAKITVIQGQTPIATVVGTDPK